MIYDIYRYNQKFKVKCSNIYIYIFSNFATIKVVGTKQNTQHLHVNILENVLVELQLYTDEQVLQLLNKTSNTKL